jgi:hypothetical protein
MWWTGPLTCLPLLALFIPSPWYGERLVQSKAEGSRTTCGERLVLGEVEGSRTIGGGSGQVRYPFEACFSSWTKASVDEQETALAGVEEETVANHSKLNADERILENASLFDCS